MSVSASLDTVLDNRYQSLSLSQALRAPVSALAGITPEGVQHLAALNITTIGDLGRNRYFRWAAALTDLIDSGAS